MRSESDFDSSSKSKSPSRSFSLSLPFQFSKNKAQAARATLSQIKLRVELSIQDLEGFDAERLRFKIRGTREVSDLWMMRSDVHQLISKRQSQAEAAQRVNALLPLFEGWIPRQQMTQI
jgi:predicted component of type VI protein secretion system